MAWVYADYLTMSDTPAQIARLKQHILEVSQTLANPQSQSISGDSYTLANLVNYLQSLKSELLSLETVASNSGKSAYAHAGGGYV